MKQLEDCLFTENPSVSDASGWHVGAECAVHVSRDRRWYRGIISDVIEDSYKVPHCLTGSIHARHLIDFLKKIFLYVSLYLIQFYLGLLRVAFNQSFYSFPVNEFISLALYKW